ncbi:MAG: AraC family transcriptional regulator [Planctomycetota bacterium]|nr:AraC family transcriptional regulator [Planctomycetota bacterium]
MFNQDRPGSGHDPNQQRKQCMWSRMDKIMRWEDEARATEYSVSKLARHLKTSSRQLERYFRMKFDCSPKAWINSLKIKDAANLLRRGVIIKEVAFRLGYKNATHFSRAYRRWHGANATSGSIADFR